MLKNWWVIHWINGKSQPLGPLSDTSVRSKLASGELSWADLGTLASKTNKKEWNRFFEIPEFQKDLPVATFDRMQEIEASLGLASPAAVSSGGDRSIWYLQLEGSEFGPFKGSEMIRIIESNKLKGELYAWRKGLANWTLVRSLVNAKELVANELTSEASSPNAKLEEEVNQRYSRRTSLVATIAWVNGLKKETLGVCSDISISGMQLTLGGGDTATTMVVGQTYSLEIQPAGISKMNAFKVSAEVAWIDPLEKRAGFRFGKLMDSDLRSLEAYLGVKR